MTGVKSFLCDQCGFVYPIDYLRRQNGLSVCTYLPCFDTPGQPAGSYRNPLFGSAPADPTSFINSDDYDFDIDLEAIEDAL